jgi:hypothetical protein
MTAPTMAEAGSEWVEWAGGEMPVEGKTRVKFQLRGETKTRGQIDADPYDFAEARHVDWSYRGFMGGVIAYRIVRA